MSVIAPDPVSERPPTSERAAARPAHALDENRPAWRVGLVGTVAVHVALLILFLALPERVFDPSVDLTSRDTGRNFEIALNALSDTSPPPLDSEKELTEMLKTLPPQPEKEVPKEPRNPARFFVSANTLAPENLPDDAVLISNQNQQAAQPDAAFSGDSPLPAVQSDEKEGGQSLVTGSQFRQRASIAEQFEEAFRNTPHDTDAEASPEPKLRVEASAGAKTEAIEGADNAENATKTGQEGRGAKIQAPQEGAEAGRVDGEGYFAKSPKIDRNRPMPRPRLIQDSVPDAAPYFTIKNLDGTTRRGHLSADARWSEYGDYSGRLRDSIGLEWEKNLMNSRLLPTPGTVVKVAFVLNSSGEISEILEVSGTGNATTQYLCVSSVTNRAPYGPWTQGMIDVLGKKQTMIFTFHF